MKRDPTHEWLEDRTRREEAFERRKKTLTKRYTTLALLFFGLAMVSMLGVFRPIIGARVSAGVGGLAMLLSLLMGLLWAVQGYRLTREHKRSLRD